MLLTYRTPVRVVGADRTVSQASRSITSVGDTEERKSFEENPSIEPSDAANKRTGLFPDGLRHSMASVSV
jgi:hypothetical protein